jgi:hypothetical protein
LPDATGTPTDLGIPTYNVNADAPSGLGFNEAMEAIDALIADRAPLPGSATPSGSAAVWNGTSWDSIEVSSSPALVTSLPGSPGDGDQAILVDSTTAPTYAWLMQYGSSIEDGATDYKWIFLGGSPLRVAVDTNETTTTVGSFVDLATVVSVTVPVAGMYDIRHGASLYTAANDTFAYATVKLGSAAASTSEAALHRGRAGDMASVSRQLRKTLAASDVVKQQYQQSGAGSMQVDRRWISILPHRLA